MKTIQEIENQGGGDGDDEQQQSCIHVLQPLVWDVDVNCRLRAFQRHGFKHVGSVFGLVGSGFQDFVQFFELDQLNRIGLTLKQLRNSLAADAVGFILQAV